MSTTRIDSMPNDWSYHWNGFHDTDAAIWSPTAKLYWQRRVVPVKEMTAKQKDAALAKHARRLK